MKIQKFLLILLILFTGIIATVLVYNNYDEYSTKKYEKRYEEYSRKMDEERSYRLENSKEAKYQRALEKGYTESNIDLVKANEEYWAKQSKK